MTSSSAQTRSARPGILGRSNQAFPIALVLALGVPHSGNSAPLSRLAFCTSLLSSETSSAHQAHSLIANAWTELLTQERRLTDQETEWLAGLGQSGFDSFFDPPGSLFDSAIHEALADLARTSSMLIDQGALSTDSLVSAIRTQAEALFHGAGKSDHIDREARENRSSTHVPVTLLEGHKQYVHSASFSPVGTKIVTASGDKTARVWDLEGNLLATLNGHTDDLFSASFSSDGTKIVTAGWDKTARVWDLQGKLIATLQGHTGELFSASFSPDGSKIVTASRDRTARVWDLDGNLLATLNGHAERVYTASFSPDGSKIVTASRDRTARVWAVDYFLDTENGGSQL